MSLPRSWRDSSCGRAPRRRATSPQRPEVGSLVGKRGGRGCRLLCHKLQRYSHVIDVELGIAPTVQADRRPEDSIREVEAKELSVFDAAPDYELIPLGSVSYVLQLVLELIRPERVDVVIWPVVAEDRPRHGSTHLLGVVVVLHTHSSEDRMQVIGNIAGGVDPYDVGPTARVDKDAVVQSDRRRGDRLDVRLDARSNDGKIALDAHTSLGEDPLQSLLAFESHDRILGDQLDAVPTMYTRHHCAGLSTKHGLER